MQSNNLRHTHLYSHKLIAKSFAQCLQLTNTKYIECTSIRNIDPTTNDISINIEIKMTSNNMNKFDKIIKIMSELNNPDTVTFKTMKSVLLRRLAFDPFDLRLKTQQIDMNWNSNSVARQLSTHMVISSDSKLDTVSPDGPKATMINKFKNSTGGLLEMPPINAGTKASQGESTTTMDTPQPQLIFCYVCS